MPATCMQNWTRFLWCGKPSSAVGDTSASQMKAKQFARYVNKQYLLMGKKGKTAKRSRLSHTKGAGDIADSKEKRTRT